jgi:hypothetical protein
MAGIRERKGKGRHDVKGRKCEEEEKKETQKDITKTKRCSEAICMQEFTFPNMHPKNTPKYPPSCCVTIRRKCSSFRRVRRV